MKKINFILLLLCNSVLYSQELKVSADKNPAIVGEQILIQYSINENGENFISPNFNGLQVLSGPNPSTQSSYTFVNGKSKSTISASYSYYIKAIKEGSYNITPASIKINGKTISSSNYELKVVKAAQKSKSQKAALRKNLFIKVEVDKKDIVVGEQILVIYKLYTRIDLHNTELSSLPDLNGFWSKDLETSSRFKRNIIDGVPYNVATVKKSVLTAQKSGKLIIDPMQLKCSIIIQAKRNNRDPFANFFGGGHNVKEEIISSEPISINVTELPTPPSNYSGAVGQMVITSEVDNTTINANDAITYKVTITGTGNIELIKPLDISFPNDFEVYDPKVSERIFEGGRKRSIKTFEYLLIPRYKGNYSIPSAILTIYNVKKKDYETKYSKDHKLKILESINKEEEEKTNTHQQAINSEQKDINFIFTDTVLVQKEESIIPKSKFLFLFFLPILLLFLLIIYNRFSIKTDKNSKDWKNKKANKIALKRLFSAQICINNDNFDLFFEETEKSLWGYFADKFQVLPAQLSKETVSLYFENLSIKKEIEIKFIKLLDECQFARYAPTNNKNSQMGEILHKAKEIIIEVETELK